MRTYIIICCFADKIAGGPIYYSNKVRYMEEQGWNVVVIPADTGKKAAVPGLAKYFGPYVPYLGYMPSEFNKRQRERIMAQLMSFVPDNQDEIVIETGNDYTAYWGELLAQRIKAKHVVIFLDENNPFITADVIGFYKFKYDRNELACITKPVMQNLFKGFMELSLEQCKALPCDCTNSIEDYDDLLIEKVNKAKYNIGYIGRLEKPFMPAILNGFVEFCKAYPCDSISITFFGGAYHQNTINEIESMFQSFKNVTTLISGYMYPLPIKALQKVDVFVSGAGSAFVAAKAGVYSVNIDVLNYQPTGVFVADVKGRTSSQCPLGNTVLDYLKWILVDKTELPLPPAEDYKNDWQKVCNAFSLHLNFIKNSSSTIGYFDIINMSTSKGRKKRIMRSVIGVEGYEKLHTGMVQIVKNLKSLING